ncbi:putative DNA polymerase II [delta proteobacterium NaphS2]|nr:putative DNA polymerase II [delta proteobacterium NaphS2]
MYEGFILSSRQIQIQNRTQLVFQGRLSDGRRFHWTVTHPPIVFFVDRHQKWAPSGAFRKSLELCNLAGNPVDGLYFSQTTELFRARKACAERAVTTYEADVNLPARFLMEHFIKGGVRFESKPPQTQNGCLFFVDPKICPSDYTPELKTLSIDIECSMRSELYSIALYGEGIQKVLVVAPNKLNEKRKYLGFPDERSLLKAFFSFVDQYDPDVLIGWNLIGFDLRWLYRKCNMLNLSFDIGRNGPMEMLAPGKNQSQWIARISGRAAIDGIPMVRSAYVKVDGYSLATVSQKVLGRKKLIEKNGREKVDEITRRFKEDKSALAAYNLEDARLVHEIFEKLNLTKLAVRRSQLTGLAIDRTGGSVAAFDFLYLPLLHRRGYVAYTDPQPPVGHAAPGGLVLSSQPGFYENVAILDFKSLYPSIIRTFFVDPLAANRVLHPPGNDPKPSQKAHIVKGPAGLFFDVEWAILPEIIKDLWNERDRAKKANDATLSQAVKILMNSFYGVLGSQGCRFYDPRIAGTITRTGHWVLNFSKKFIEQNGFRVIYGDTDSLFVCLGTGDSKKINELGQNLVSRLNAFFKKELKERFGVESYLDIEFEKIFLRFFMPTIRGQDSGSKKRYAGLLSGNRGKSKLYFAGLESSRRDWTTLAKKIQSDLFALIFADYDEPDLKETLEELVKERHHQLFAGELDQQLIYRKGISKPLKDYTKTAPPHVRAARMLDDFEGRVIRYVMTTNGPEPIQQRSGAMFDYEHYSEKQLAPVADMVLRFFDLDYQAITSNQNQLNLFEP